MKKKHHGLEVWVSARAALILESNITEPHFINNYFEDKRIKVRLKKKKSYIDIFMFP